MGGFKLTTKQEIDDIWEAIETIIEALTSINEEEEFEISETLDVLAELLKRERTD